jgi:ribosome maturation factor RimP
MISESRITELFEQIPELSQFFIVEIKVSKDNEIFLSVDTDSGITIDECAEISRIINEKIDREVEDFDLEVSSPGLSGPFKVLRQYQKNTGKNVEIVLKDGTKLSGKLLSADQNGIKVETERKEKQNKKTVKIQETKDLGFDGIKTTKLKITFK